MKYRVHSVCRPQLGAGIRLAGLESHEVASPGEAAEHLATLADTAGVGLVLVEEELYDQLPESLRRRMGRRPLPMIVPFPGPRWTARPGEAEAYIVELLRQVVGYRVRLR